MEPGRSRLRNLPPQRGGPGGRTTLVPMPERQVADYYDHYWSHEELVVGGNQVGPAVQAILADVVGADSACLEVGCGPGSTVGTWAASCAESYVGVDVSQPAVEKARGLGLDARVIEDATALPFEDGSFDVVFCLEVLEHLFDPASALTEMKRVLRAGASLVVTVPNVVYWRRRLELLVGWWNPVGDDYSIERPWRDPHIRFFNPASLQRLLVEAGFEGIAIGGNRGALLRHLPYLAHLAPDRPPSRIYRRLERRFPALLGARVDGRAQKPAQVRRGTAEIPTRLRSPRTRS